MNGKGDKRRPSNISISDWEEKWENAFRKEANVARKIKLHRQMKRKKK